MKETPMNTATDIEAEAKAQNLIAQKDGIKEKDIQDLIASLDKLDEDTRKAAIKKAASEGYGHLTMDYEVSQRKKEQEVAIARDPSITKLSTSQIRANVARDKFGGMSPEVLAKQKVMQQYNKTNRSDPGYQNMNVAMSHILHRAGSFEANGKQKFNDAQSTEQRSQFAAAKTKYDAENGGTT